MRTGNPPLVVVTGSPQESVVRLVNEVVALIRGGTPPGNVLIMYGDQVDRGRLHDQLTRQLGDAAVWWMNHPLQKYAPHMPSDRSPLRMAHVRTATGLEAKTVFLLGVESLLLDPSDDARTPRRLLLLNRKNKRQLYMAMTRAAYHLAIFTSEPPPASLGTLFCFEARTEAPSSQRQP
jgi:superfamily I DNA and RNA helicase